MRFRNGFRTVLVTALAIMVMFSAAAAQEDSSGSTRQTASFDHGNFGIGVIFGEPTGLSGKMWTTKNTGFDVGLAWSWSGDGHFHIHGDYLFHNFGLFDVSEGALPVYIGLGARILFRDDEDDKLGVRLPIGLEYYFDEWPVAVFGEVVPILDLAPSTKGDINGGLGVRFYF
jgi:hypothetical protein